MNSLVVRVRPRIRSRSSGREAVLRVLANGGAKSPKPCLVVGEDQAQSLGLWPASDAKVYLVEEASSVRKVFLLPDVVELELLDEEVGRK